MLGLGVFAVVIGHFLRAESHRWLHLLWLETIVFTAIPIIAWWWVNRRVMPKVSADSKKLYYGLQAGALGMGLLVLLAQVISRSAGFGDANEIVVLTLVQYVSWYLVVFAGFGFRKVAFILVASLVLFVCFIAQSNSVFVTSFLFAVLALWWLLGSYWSRVNNKALDGDSKTLPINSIAVGINLAVVSVVGLAAWMLVPPEAGLLVDGFSPFSGGRNGGESDFARSGIGDGNMLTAGANATSAGAVESDQFIEDDKPSMYDISVEKFEGPKVVRKKQNRAIALDVMAKHLHKVIKSEQSGKTFRTVRKPRKSDIELEDKITRALFFVEGSVPARFSLDYFDEFDGWDWTKNDIDQAEFPLPQIHLESRSGKNWYTVRRVRREYMSSRRPHLVKIMRLSSKRVPSPSMLERWHIDKAESPTLFRWDNSGSLEMAGDFIPSHTMIHTVSSVPNFYTLRANDLNLENQPNQFWTFVDRWVLGKNFTAVKSSESWAGDPDSQYLQIPQNRTTERLNQLVGDWTRQSSRGWNQVEAIVDRLRNEFELDSESVSNEDSEDTVGDFLDRGAGPSYMFATVATQMLRAAGYQTRLVSGFIARRQDFDRVSNQSVITSDNLHMWPEVCLDGQNWIPVEATPGYPEPFSDSTLWQRFVATINGFAIWSYRNAVSTFCLVLLVGCAVRFRFAWLAASCWLLWLGALFALPRNRLRWTRRLIDLRFWAAGIPRPAFTPISAWYSQVEDNPNNQFCRIWLEDNFSSARQRRPRGELIGACKGIVKDLSYKKIKAFANSFRTKNES